MYKKIIVQKNKYIVLLVTGSLEDGCQDEDECQLQIHNCDRFATCSNTNGSYDCTCQEGFTGDGFNCKVSCRSFVAQKKQYDIGCCHFYHLQKLTPVFLAKSVKCGCVFVNFNLRCTIGNILFTTGKITPNILSYSRFIVIFTPMLVVKTPCTL